MPILLDTIALALLGAGTTLAAQGAIEIGSLLLVGAVLTGLAALATSIKELAK